MPDVVDDEGSGRLTVTVGGSRAELEYRRAAGHLVLEHTRVPDELEGQGVGAALVRAAVDKAEALDLIVTPECPFARGWLARHPDIARRVRIELPRQDDASG